MAEVVSFKRDGEGPANGLVLSSRAGGVLRLTLNNPPANVLSIAMMKRFMPYFHKPGRIQVFVSW